jgi:ribosomal protein S18 acetylase RimI-like enzyme
MTTEIRMLGPADIALVCSTPEDVFDDLPEHSLTEEFLSDPRHHLVAAIEAGQIIGFVSSVHYLHPDKPPELWINEIGVIPAHQRRGLGQRLVEAMLARGRELGCKNAWVLTDRSNTPAMKLYSQAGGVEASTPAIMFEFPLHLDQPPAAQVSREHDIPRDQP